jgi:hypothetical protein
MSIDAMEMQYYGWITPVVPSPYRMRTTQIAEHSHGVFWTADVIDKDGAIIGYIEQMGNGGSDYVSIDPKHALDWRCWLESAYPDASNRFEAEERASGWLLYQEDSQAEVR